MQKLIYSTLQFGLNKEVIYPLQFFEVMKCVLKIFVGNRPIYLIAQKNLFNLLEISYSIPNGGYKNRFDVLPIQQRANAMLVALWLFEDWPNRFIEFFRSTGFSSSDLLRDTYLIPYWYYQVVYRHFFINNVTRHFYL